MRENRPYGSEGGEAKSLPYPYRGSAFLFDTHCPTRIALEIRLSCFARMLNRARNGAVETI